MMQRLMQEEGVKMDKDTAYFDVPFVQKEGHKIVPEVEYDPSKLSEIDLNSLPIDMTKRDQKLCKYVMVADEEGRHLTQLYLQNTEKFKKISEKLNKTDVDFNQLNELIDSQKSLNKSINKCRDKLTKHYDQFDPKKLTSEHIRQMGDFSKKISTLDVDVAELSEEISKLVHFGIKPVKKLETEVDDDETKIDLRNNKKKKREDYSESSDDDETSKLQRTSEFEEDNGETGIHQIKESKRKVSEDSDSSEEGKDDGIPFNSSTIRI